MQLSTHSEKACLCTGLCWEILHSLPCRCNGSKLHLEGNHCAAHLKRLISGEDLLEGCAAECTAEVHIDLDAFKKALLDWWGADWRWAGTDLHCTAMPKPMLIPATAGDKDLSSGITPACSTAQFWLSEIESRYNENLQLKQLVGLHWFEPMLRAPGAGKLWGRSGSRRVLKELSESYSVLLKLEQNVDCSDSGGRLIYFDVCSGKGLTTLMLSFALP